MLLVFCKKKKDPCMVYFPTFTVRPMDPMGTCVLRRGFETSCFSSKRRRIAAKHIDLLSSNPAPCMEFLIIFS